MAIITAPKAPPTGEASPDGNKQVQMANPFTKASKRMTEPFGDITKVLTASAQTIQQIDVPANGYLRNVVIDVEVSGTSAAAYQADAPWNVIESVQFTDVNGQPIVQLSGYDLYLANLLGGYVFYGDPTESPRYSSGATGFSFALRVPIEIVQRNALGALANMNAAMTYKVKITLAPIADVYATNTGTPSARIRMLAETWANPLAADLMDRPNMTTPPNLGTTQNWSEYVAPTVVGQNTIRLPRVGNTIRNLVFVNRNASGVRTDTGIPETLAVLLDGNQWRRNSFDYETQRLFELYRYGAAERPAGVWTICLSDDFDGTPGDEQGDYWLATTGATRLELQGSFTAAGSLHVITNDILAWAGSAGPGQTLGA